MHLTEKEGFPGGPMGKESACSAGDTGDTGSIPGLGRFPGGWHDSPPHYSCLENSMGRSLVGYSSKGCKELDTTEATEHALREKEPPNGSFFNRWHYFKNSHTHTHRKKKPVSRNQ